MCKIFSWEIPEEQVRHEVKKVKEGLKVEKKEVMVGLSIQPFQSWIWSNTGKVGSVDALRYVATCAFANQEIEKTCSLLPSEVEIDVMEEDESTYSQTEKKVDIWFAEGLPL